MAEYKQKCYLGSCETTSKDRFENHKKSFNHVKHKNDTELSKKFREINKCNNYMENYQNMPFLQSKQ